ncbi:hypothetical protein M2137_002784 [Parabacteroides sp. PFB2-10]|uniref:glycoside hydrolase family 11 protein n=1 Tax=Parabacteroides sp. PFB2-10 TaxID=1742405 RepID=UPI002473E43F|nr:glycoside hydrolase family 11 protein [Parabacteroides sp. PFB2-10]MDH6313991.1 hypothetical protein [Parabacteroides sp. PFB2-10]
MRLRKITMAVGLLLACGLSGTMLAQENAKTFTRNATGVFEGYHYEFWTDVRPGSTDNKAIMQLTGGGSFTSEYDTSNNRNTLMRTGKKFDTKQTHSEVGEIVMEYDVDYNPELQGASYMCVYGWTRRDNDAPLVEFYIVESWGGWRPPGNRGSLGNVTIDGIEYELFVTDRINKPSIEGNTTFKQYWSIRTTKKGSGQINEKINISKHFKIWEEKGLKMGTLYEVTLCIEGFNSKGKATINKNVITIDGKAL